jgi:protein gp37
MTTTEKANRSTGIEWTEHTWNPFVGCTIHTAGCTNCYAMRAALRLQEFGMESYRGVAKQANGVPVWTGRINRSSDAQMRKPFKIKTPSLIFVNSMSDFFHEAADDAWRLEALQVMVKTPHQYQVLTKRPENIAPFIARINDPQAGISDGGYYSFTTFPPNVWIGATVERADCVHRIQTLRRVPATIRFLSIEPLIGPIGTIDLTGIHWVILGGESGPGARPMDPKWARDVRDQCAEQHVPLFFKQWGKATNNPIYWQAHIDRPKGMSGTEWVTRQDPNGKGGSLLYGREWKQYPTFGSSL